MSDGAEVLHASAVAINGAGVLILGPSGSGKSATALDLIARGAELIADDRVVVQGTPPRLSPPDALAGLVEARGIGLLRLPYRDDITAVLAIDMGRSADVRMPPYTSFSINSMCLPLIAGANNPILVLAVMAGLKASVTFPFYDGSSSGRQDEQGGAKDQA